MAYTMEDFKHDARRVWIEHLDEFDPEERDALLARMAVEDRLRGVDPEDRLRGLDPDFIKSWLRRNEH